MDYYSILGVSKDASDKDLKKAYKQKSMQHHPDRGGREEEFKEINEAYSTLKDPHKRAMYDHQQTAGQGGFNFNSGDFRGRNPFEDIFGGFGRSNNRQTRNRDVTIQLKLSLEDVLNGKQLVTRYQTQNGKIKEADIDIPPGINEGMGIRFEGLGDDSYPQFPPGDLIVRVSIMTDRRWKKDGIDLHTIIVVSVFDCILGSTAQITTLEGKRLELKIPKGTQPSAVFSIPGHGMPDYRTGRRGNIFVKLNTIVPQIDNEDILTDIQKIKDSLA